jgi:hypothetical protein
MNADKTTHFFAPVARCGLSLFPKLFASREGFDGRGKVRSIRGRWNAAFHGT